MIFERFLKDLRESKGIKQSELAEMLYISEKTISGYETNRRQCTFDFGIEILSKLDVSVLIKNNKIELVEGDMKMEREYVNTNLNFINFNKEEFINNIIGHRNNNINRAKEELKKVYAKLESQGFEFMLSNAFEEKLWLDENYDSGTKIADFEKDSKRISLIVEGYLELSMFLVERLIELIAEKDKDISEYVYKSIMYTCATQDNGKDIYEVFRNKDSIKIVELMPTIEPYLDLVMEVLSDNYSDIIVKIDYGYDPSEISIANELGMYDCFSTPNLYFTYTMEDECEVIDYESFFEGHSIADAMNYVNEYFEDYDDYVENYTAMVNGEEDYSRDLVVLD